MVRERTTRQDRAWKAAAPILVALGILYAADDPRPAVAWIALALSAAVLIAGRRWIATTLLARIAGVYVGFATGFFAVLRAFGFSANFWWMALPAIFLAVAGLLYDLFIWQPYKGRFARARAERRGWPEQE
jgi:hypothetical protein